MVQLWLQRASTDKLLALNHQRQLVPGPNPQCRRTTDVSAGPEPGVFPPSDLMVPSDVDLWFSGRNRQPRADSAVVYAVFNILNSCRWRPDMSLAGKPVTNQTIRRERL